MTIYRNTDGTLERESGESISPEAVLRLVRNQEEDITVIDRDSGDEVTGEVLNDVLQTASPRTELVDWLGDGLKTLTARLSEGVEDAESEVQSWIDELIETGKVSPEEAQNWLEDYGEQARDAGSQLESRIRDLVSSQVERLGLARQEDLDDLKREVRDLREQLEDD